MPEPAPIVLFTYNRPKHTEITLNKLKECVLAQESDLVVFSDAAADEKNKHLVMECRKLIKEQKGFKSVQLIERETNMGLANSIISGLNQVFKTYDKVIVLEDDMLVGKHFLEFMNAALEQYKDNKAVYTISAYSYRLPFKSSKRSYFLPTSSNQAWASWKDRWQKIDFNRRDFDELKTSKKLRRTFNHWGGPDYSGRLIEAAESEKPSSWAILYKWNQFKANGLTLFSAHNLVQNIGWDGSGTNCVAHNPYGEKIGNIDHNELHLPKEIDYRRTDLFRLILFFYKIKVKEFWRIRILKKV